MSGAIGSSIKDSMQYIAILNSYVGDSIEDSIRQLTMNVIDGIDSIINTIINTKEINRKNDMSNIFNITAEFPDANDVQTIKDAILSLPNVASQYINIY